MEESTDAAVPPGMVKCDITGQIVPENETVVIQGYRVGAEGKEELIQRLEAGERMPGELERSTVLRRFGAWLLDGIIIGVVNAVFGLVIAGAAIVSPQPGIAFAVLQIISILIPFVYYVWMHGARGQTVGKMAAHIKVVRPDGSPINMSAAFGRYLWYMGPQIIMTLVLVVAFMSENDPFVAVAGILAVIPGIYILVSIVLALVDQAQQRAIHDRLSRTRVIMVD